MGIKGIKITGPNSRKMIHFFSESQICEIKAIFFISKADVSLNQQLSAVIKYCV